MANPILQRFVDELVSSAVFVDHCEDAASAEAWASGAFADWQTLADGEIDPVQVVGLNDVAAHLIELMADPGRAVDRDRLSGRAWGSDVDTHVLVDAHRVRDGGTNAAIILEYEAASGAQHDLTLTVDAGVVVAATIGPPGLAEAILGDPTSAVSVESIDEPRIADVLAELRFGLDDASSANGPLLQRRLGVQVGVTANDPTEPLDLARDPGADAWARSIIERTIPLEPTTQRRVLGEIAASIDERRATGDPDIWTLEAVACSDDAAAMIGAYLAPRNLDVHPADEAEAIAWLEPADWVGAISGIAVSAPGTAIDGDTLVTMINRSSVVTTTIPKTDRALVAWALERTLYAFEIGGVLDETGQTTQDASAILGLAARAAWGDSATPSDA